MSLDKDVKYLRMAESARHNSPDPSSKIGAIIVNPEGVPISLGCNKFPLNIAALPERLERPLKYHYIEHAERNAIYSAARTGWATAGSVLYMVGMGPPTVPCIECCKAVIQAGIKEVVGCGYKTVEEHWIGNLNKSKEMLEEGKILFRDLTDHYPDVILTEHKKVY